MQAFRKPLALAQQVRATSEARDDAASPERSATATSGTYYRAVRPEEAELAASPQSARVVDAVKVEGLRFELEVGTWRSDSERIARGMIADAECEPEADDPSHDPSPSER